jgi:hypothetical protein
VLVVGHWDDATLDGWFTGCEPAGEVRNAEGVDNDEDGVRVRRCGAPREGWDRLWPQVRRLG